MKKIVKIMMVMAVTASGAITCLAKTAVPQAGPLAQPVKVIKPSAPPTKEVPPVFAELEKLLQEKKYDEAIKIIDLNLEQNPKDYRLIMLKSFIYFKHLQNQDEAIKIIDNALAASPKVYDLYDFKIQLLHQQNAPDMQNKLMLVFTAIAANYADEPVTVSELGMMLLKQKLGEKRLQAALLLLRSAKMNMQEATASQKFLICTNLARGYYFASRADLAVKEQAEANSYADNDLDKVQGSQLLDFYKEADEMAKQL